jgi:putative ABC transport system ATP-binding protein
MDLLRRLNVELKKTLVVVTHDEMAAQRAQRTLHLDKGRLLDRGTAPPATAAAAAAAAR